MEILRILAGFGALMCAVGWVAPDHLRVPAVMCAIIAALVLWDFWESGK